jgi:adenylate cyclase
MKTILSAFHLTGIILATTVLLALCTMRIWDPGVVEVIRNRAFDQMQLVSPRDDLVDSPVRVVDIDDDALAELGQWPWPRHELAHLVDQILAQGALAIGFDILLVEADRTSPARIKETYPGLVQDDVADQLPDHDAILARTISNKPISLGVGHKMSTNMAGWFPVQPREGVGSYPGTAILGGDPWSFLPRAGELLTPLPELAEASGLMGNVIPAPEQDGIARRIPTVVATEDRRLLPWLALSTTMEAIDSNTLVIRSNEAGVRSISVGGLTIPTDSKGRIWLRYRPYDPSLYVSAADVMTGRVDEDEFRNKIVYLGSSATALGDLHDFPFGRSIPGVEAHVQFSEMMMTQSFITRPTDADTIEILLAFAAGMIVMVSTLALSARMGVSVLVTLVGGLAYGSWRAFDQHDLLLDATFPIASATLVYAVLALLNLLRAERQRLFMKAAFAHYLPAELVTNFVRNPKMLRLGGENRELTILFCDIRGFTSMAEILQDRPDQLSLILNELFKELSQVVIEHGGTIDKYMGDAMMCFWNAPLEVPGHEGKAVAAALEIRRRIAPINDRLSDILRMENIDNVPFIQLGIGIATGVSLVGNMGSDLRFNYTALGDSVNLASRLENLTQKYHVPVLISETTAATLGDRFVLIEIDRVRVKGKHDAGLVYAPLGSMDMLGDEIFRAYVNDHARMLEAMRAGDADAATDAAMSCLSYPEASSELYAYYLERIGEMGGDT